MPGRCFIAVDLPEVGRERLATAQDLLREAAPAWRHEKWVDPRLLHVTMAFLGAVPDAALHDTLLALEAASSAAQPFTLRFTGARAVRSTGHATMLWATAEASFDLTQLRDALLRAARCPADERAFRPHITLARARRPRRIQPSAVGAAGEMLSDAGKGPDGTMSVRSLTVYASTLGPSGPVYESLGTLPLGIGPGDTGQIDTEHVFA